MDIIGIIGTFDDLADQDQLLGRKVASYSFISALLEYCEDAELHFFLPFSRAAKVFNEKYEELLDKPGVRERVRLIHSTLVPEMLAKTPYQAIHATEMDQFFTEMCHLRNRLAPAPFPVTCTPHSLNYWITQVRHLYKVMPGIMPYDAICATSRAAVDHLKAVFKGLSESLRKAGFKNAGYGGGIELAPLGVRAASFGGVEKAKARRELGLPEDEFVLLCLGRLTAMDKFDTIPLLAVLFFMNQVRPTRLVLAGAHDGKEPPVVLGAARAMKLDHKLKLVTNFPGNQKASLFAACDVFISPSDNLQETFGLTIIEAMAAKRPVVASDFSGYRDLVKNGRTGFLIPCTGPGHMEFMDKVWPIANTRVCALQSAQRTALDLEPMLEAIRRFAVSDSLATQMGQAGRARVETKFDWPVVIKHMRNIWRRLKKTADESPARPVPPDPLNLGQDMQFGHFYSHHLAPEQILTPGLLAKPFQNGGWGKIIHPDLAPCFDPQKLSLLLGAMKQAGGSASLSWLGKELAPEIDAQELEHLAHYGLKYGVLAKAAQEA